MEKIAVDVVTFGYLQKTFDRESLYKKKKAFQVPKCKTNKHHRLFKPHKV